MNTADLVTHTEFDAHIRDVGRLIGSKVDHELFGLILREQARRDKHQNRIERALIVAGALFDLTVVVLALDRWLW